MTIFNDKLFVFTKNAHTWQMWPLFSWIKVLWSVSFCKMYSLWKFRAIHVYMVSIIVGPIPALLLGYIVINMIYIYFIYIYIYLYISTGQIFIYYLYLVQNKYSLSYLYMPIYYYWSNVIPLWGRAFEVTCSVVNNKLKFNRSLMEHTESCTIHTYIHASLKR